MSNEGQKKICIICEGFEEKEYLDALINKAVFASKYDIVTINAKTIDNISARYQEKFQSDSYHLILVFCDTDKTPFTKYNRLKLEIDEIHGNAVASKIIMFGNPCTMQIILSHFGHVDLKTQSKTVNSAVIKEYTDIENYKAKEEQRKELFKKINRRNYQVMKKNILNVSTDDKVVPSTNILSFLEKLELDDDSWIDDINMEL